MAGSEEQVLRNLALRHSAAFAPASAAAGVIGASSVLAVLAGRADVNKLTIWFGAILLSHLLVVLTSHRVLRLDPTRPRFEWALRARWASLAASGAAWGILVLLPAGPQTPIAVRSIGLIVAGGMIGISSARAGDRLGFWCFWIPVTGSMLSALVLAGDAALVAAIAVLAAYAALANRRYSSAVVDLLRVEHQNESLVSQLRDQARELERAASTDPLTGAANRREFDRILHILETRGYVSPGAGAKPRQILKL